MTKGIQRSTPQLRAVLQVLMRAGPHGEVYGFQVAEETDLLPGSIYPIFLRLYHAGWVTKRVEDVDPHEVERPPRIYYSLTAEGARRASALLSTHKRPKMKRHGHLGVDGNHGDVQ